MSVELSNFEMLDDGTVKGEVKATFEDPALYEKFKEGEARMAPTGFGKSALKNRNFCIACGEPVSTGDLVCNTCSEDDW